MSDIVHFMKSTVAPLLLPILRSRGQAEMLCAILANPDREWTLAELANVSQQSLPTVQREVERAEMAELVKSRRVGRSRLRFLDSTLHLAHRVQIVLYLHLVGSAQLPPQAGDIRAHPIKDAGIPLQLGATLTRGAAVPENPFKHHSRVSLGRQGRGW